MKRSTLFFAFLILSFFSFAQKDPDTELTRRLNEYLRLTRELMFGEIMDYTHPKIFQFVTKEQMVEIYRQSFDNETMKIEFDSVAILKISESFSFENVLYKRVDYNMKIAIRFKDTAALNDESFINATSESFRNSFAGGVVVFNRATKKFEVTTQSIMIAIRDNETAPWLFLGYEKGSDILKQIYPQEVLVHFQL
jgi:hypothetical protein